MILSCYIYCTFLSLLHAWAIDVRAVAQSFSNCSGWDRKCGNCSNRTAFRWFSSLCGRAGLSLHPLGVHSFRMSSPKTASLANFTARLPILDSFPNKLACFWRTSWTFFTLARLMSEEGSSANREFLGAIGSGWGSCCIGTSGIAGICNGG